MSNDQSALVPTVVDMPMDFTVIARNPSEMEKAQKSLILWAARKIQFEKELMGEAREQHEIAVKNKWRATAWHRRVKLSEKRIDFYKKIKMALEAGYYIVPPFPIDIFAVRTNEADPRPNVQSGHWNDHAQKGRLLSAGDGRYVSQSPVIARDRWTETDKDGKSVLKTQSWAESFREVDFPFKFAKPAVLQATAEAMALKIFDRIGVLPRYQSADPVVCGQILKPDTYRTPITFFVAWWLDTKTV